MNETRGKARDPLECGGRAGEFHEPAATPLSDCPRAGGACVAQDGKTLLRGCERHAEKAESSASSDVKCPAVSSASLSISSAVPSPNFVAFCEDFLERIFNHRGTMDTEK